MRKRLILLVLAIALVFLLTSCTWHFTISMPLPTTPLECSLRVISRNDRVGGYVYVDGKNTEKFLEPWEYVVINNVPCYQTVSVWLVAPPGYFSRLIIPIIPPDYFSHVEHIYTIPSEENSVYFYYW